MQTSILAYIVCVIRNIITILSCLPVVYPLQALRKHNANNDIR